MNSTVHSAANFISQNYQGLAHATYGVFGLMDFIHVYRHPEMTTTLKVAYLARGFFYVAAKTMYLINFPTGIPFFTANLLGFGLHSIECRNSSNGYEQAKQTFGIISNIAYMILLRVPHPGILCIALLAGGTKIILSAARMQIRINPGKSLLQST